MTTRIPQSPEELKRPKLWKAHAAGGDIVVEITPSNYRYANYLQKEIPLHEMTYITEREFEQVEEKPEGITTLNAILGTRGRKANPTLTVTMPGNTPQTKLVEVKEVIHTDTRRGLALIFFKGKGKEWGGYALKPNYKQPFTVICTWENESAPPF